MNLMGGTSLSSFVSRSKIRSAMRLAACAHGGGPLTTQRRCMEYWELGVTGRTQPYAQGDMFPRLDNTRYVVNKPSAAGAALTGNQNNIVYDSSNIFSVLDYSAVEKDHYQPLRGVTKYKIDAVTEDQGQATATLILELLEPEVLASLEYLWWAPLLKDFPALRKVCTPSFKKEWQDFYVQCLRLVHDEAAVTALAAPFVRTQHHEKYISFPIFWRIAEKLSDGLEQAPRVSRYERMSFRVSVETQPR